MAVYKSEDTYYYEFVFKGTRYRESTHQGNKNVARDMESARRSALAKGEVGILDRPRPPRSRNSKPDSSLRSKRPEPKSRKR